jgi:hypothetical protein
VDQDAEATHSYVRAVPGRVFARLARRTADGTLIRGMHIEFTPAQALRMARDLSECARIAIARDQNPLATLKADPPDEAAIVPDAIPITTRPFDDQHSD